MELIFTTTGIVGRANTRLLHFPKTEDNFFIFMEKSCSASLPKSQMESIFAKMAHPIKISPDGTIKQLELQIHDLVLLVATGLVIL